MKQIIKTALLVAACAFIVSLVYNKLLIPRGDDILLSVPVQSVELAGETIRVTVADSPEEREVGLSGREGLARDEGMLFIFPEDRKYAFWMKDMSFSLDILWLSAEGVVVDMQQGISPDTYPATFTPRTKARYVLELPAGWVKEYNVRVGDIARF